VNLMHILQKEIQSGVALRLTTALQIDLGVRRQSEAATALWLTLC
jgi:hypothetical protein